MFFQRVLKKIACCDPVFDTCEHTQTSLFVDEAFLALKVVHAIGAGKNSILGSLFACGVMSKSSPSMSQTA
ncbi:hypothetical protein AYJ54_24235 [Bradyrhizobium centrolobii]|uniref:Uncharacterized protein n=2 Tax=Bradyrhizobium TaxID=374 RepID=A0A176YL28_9BRAD|nr:hypothetical protein AYJ54_24235 [Bradyrhizobium centrolobii]OAF07706.1 hypothetical protein AXW67_29575 [Bradyrhizobium neotropicale]